jgi:type 1 glutamine amidotransferase
MPSDMTRRDMMKIVGAAAAGLSIDGGAQASDPQQRQAAPGSANPAEMGGMATPRRPGRKNLLAWADVRNGFQHDCITHALCTMEHLGYVSELYDTYIRTDSQPITQHGLYGSDGQIVYGKDLKDFDAIFFFGVRQIDLTAQQRSDLLSFVHDDGGGFIAAHSAATAFLPMPQFSWPEFNEMLGGEFVNHPWHIIEAPVIVDDPHFPATSFLPPSFHWHDEMYQLQNVSRDKVDVVLRLDVSKLNTNIPAVQIKNGDWPLAWAKTYGKGRVFYCALGHPRTNWDIPDMQRIYYEGIKWVLKLSDADIAPHPMRQVNAAPTTLGAPTPPSGPSWALKDIAIHQKLLKG